MKFTDLSPQAQTMVKNLWGSPLEIVMRARLQAMVDEGLDHDGTGKEVTDFMRHADENPGAFSALDVSKSTIVRRKT